MEDRQPVGWPGIVSVMVVMVMVVVVVVVVVVVHPGGVGCGSPRCGPGR